MIALTKEKREELAKFAKATLNSLNGIEPENPNQYDDCLSEYTQMCMEIALTSLTADDVGSIQWSTGYQMGLVPELNKGIELPQGTRLLTTRPVPAVDGIESDVRNIIQLLSDREWAEHCTSTELGKELESQITDLCNEVPEIKLPEHKRNGKPLNILAELVWAECIDEIKRLNGLGE